MKREEIKKKFNGLLSKTFNNTVDTLKGKNGIGAAVTAGIAVAAVGMGIGFAFTPVGLAAAIFVAPAVFEAACSHQFAKINARDKAKGQTLKLRP